MEGNLPKYRSFEHLWPSLLHHEAQRRSARAFSNPVGHRLHLGQAGARPAVPVTFAYELHAQRPAPLAVSLIGCCVATLAVHSRVHTSGLLPT
jgi:hypothetical protein